MKYLLISFLLLVSFSASASEDELKFTYRHDIFSRSFEVNIQNTSEKTISVSKIVVNRKEKNTFCVFYPVRPFQGATPRFVSGRGTPYDLQKQYSGVEYADYLILEFADKITIIFSDQLCGDLLELLIYTNAGNIVMKPY